MRHGRSGTAYPKTSMITTARSWLTDRATVAWRAGAFGSLAEQSMRPIKTLTTVRMRSQLKQLAKALSSLQLPTNGDNIFIFATPRSGSTWLMELILSQPGFRACDQPLDIRNPYVRRHLGISQWVDLYQRDAEPRIERYFKRICDGRIRGLITPGRHHRLVSRRLVFKVQNGWQDRIAWIGDVCGGRIVLLIRHPIAVTISRKELPRLHAFVQSDYARHFNSDLIRFAEEIIASGSFFRKGILHWCFENSVPLWAAAKTDWNVVSYEELVTNSIPVLEYLAHRLELPAVGRMRQHLKTPSRTISKSSARTQALVGTYDRQGLINKWRRHVSEEDEQAAFDIVEAFGIDAYRPGRDMPNAKYLIAPNIATH